MHGKGTHEYPDGSKYEGKYRLNKFDGKGKITFESGASYNGNWLAG
jgi:hypothetical protein